MSTTNSDEEIQHKKILSDLLWYCVDQDLFGNVNEGKTEPISDDKINNCQTKLVHWVLDKTNYNLEVSKKFISFAISEYPNLLFELLEKNFSKNIKTIWWQYETKQKIAEKSSNIERPDLEAKMENGQGTSTFSNKKQVSLEDNELGTAEVVATKKSEKPSQTLREAWNDVNNVSDSVIQSGENLGNARLAKAQAIASGAVNVAQSASNVLSSTMSLVATPQIITDLTNMVVSETTSYVTSAVKDVTLGTLTYTAKFPVRIISLTSYYYKQFLSNYKITLDDIIMPEESKAQIELEKSKILEKKKILDAKTQKVQEGIGKINKVISKVTNGMNNIAAYIGEGPEWAEEQCTKLLFNGLSYIGKLRDDTLDNVYKKLENKADSIAYAAASKDFKDFDEKMRDKLKKQYEKIQVNAMKVKLKAAQSVAVAKSKIIAKLGL